MENKQELTNEVSSIFSLSELFALPPESKRFVVDGLLPNRGFSLLTGRPKAGKSHLVRQLVAAVATGSQFLGRNVEPGSVLYYGLEEKPEEVRDHFELLGLRDCLGEVVSVFGIDSKYPLESVIDQASSIKELRLIVIDPVMRCLKVKDGNSYTENTAATAPLMKFARSNDLHVMAVHHISKRPTDDPRDATLGSQALNGAVDTILTLQEVQGNRVISSAQRYGAGLERTAINWDPSTRYMSLGNVQTEVEMGDKEAYERNVSFNILSFVAENPGSGIQEIRTAIGVKGVTVHNGCKSLVRQGLLRCDGTGRRGDPYRLWIGDVTPQESVH